MIFVFEGPDGVGKSTLANALATHLPGVERINSGPPPEGDLMAHYFEQVARAACAPHAIFDRFHRGEQVYGPLLRGGSRLSASSADLVDDLLLRKRAVLVHCTASLATIQRRLVSRDGGVDDPKSGAKLDHAAAIRVGFMHLLGAYTGGPRLAKSRWTVIDMNMYMDTAVAGLMAVGRDRQSIGGL